jgi:hypothetical protein
MSAVEDAALPVPAGIPGRDRGGRRRDGEGALA